MPALLPPDIQIGALPPGYSTLPSTGPSRTGLGMPAQPTLLQNAGFSTNTSGPTNISQTVTSTGKGTYLVWIVAVNASAGAALGGTPTNWTLTASQSVATLALGIYTFQNNPGGITAVTFSSNATATTGGISSWFYEVDNVFGATSNNNSATGSSTAPASGSVTPKLNFSLIIGAVGWVLGSATFTSTSTNGTGQPWTVTAQQSSTNGTTNAALQTGTTLGASGAVAAAQFQGTLSVSSVWDAGILVLPSTASGNILTDTAPATSRVDQGAGYSAAGGLWGALGNPKAGVGTGIGGGCGNG